MLEVSYCFAEFLLRENRLANIQSNLWPLHLTAMFFLINDIEGVTLLKSVVWNVVLIANYSRRRHLNESHNG